MNSLKLSSLIYSLSARAESRRFAFVVYARRVPKTQGRVTTTIGQEHSARFPTLAPCRAAIASQRPPCTTFSDARWFVAICFPATMVVDDQSVWDHIFSHKSSRIIRFTRCGVRNACDSRLSGFDWNSWMCGRHVVYDYVKLGIWIFKLSVLVVAWTIIHRRGVVVKYRPKNH